MLSTLTKKVRTVVILRSFDSHAVIALDEDGPALSFVLL